MPYSWKVRTRAAQTSTDTVPRAVPALQQRRYRLHASVMVSGSHRVPSPSRNHPLKSIAQTAFGLAACRSGSVRGCFWRVRLRGVTRPCCLSNAPTVLAAGRSHLRSFRSSHTTSFLGPQVGCSRRSSTSRSPTAVEMARLLLLGRRERSCSPGGPAASNWCSHLYPVFGATPNAAQRLLNVDLCLRSSVTNRSRSLVASICAQGMDRDCYLCLRSDRYPCIRSGPRLNRHVTDCTGRPRRADRLRDRRRKGWTQGGNEVALRHGVSGLERRCDRNRLLPGALEELRQRLMPILRRQDLVQVNDARDAEPTVAQRFDDLWKSLDETRRRLSVVCGSLRETEL